MTRFLVALASRLKIKKPGNRSNLYFGHDLAALAQRRSTGAKFNIPRPIQNRSKHRENITDSWWWIVESLQLKQLLSIE